MGENINMTNINKNKKQGVIKKIVVVGLLTATLIGGGKFIYDKIQNAKTSGSIDPIEEVKNYHEQSDNYKDLILDSSTDLLSEKNHKLEEIYFNNNDDGSLSIFTQVNNQTNSLDRFYEYKIADVETTNFEDIIEIVKNYDFKDNVVENICFEDKEYVQTLARDKFLGNYESPELDKALKDWKKVDEFGGYYRFEYNESGKCERAIIGGFIIAIKGDERKAIRFEYSLDFSHIEKYHAQYLRQYIRNGGLKLKEELVQEMSPNFLKSQYLGDEKYVDEFTDDEMSIK